MQNVLRCLCLSEPDLLVVPEETYASTDTNGAMASCVPTAAVETPEV